MTSERGRTIFVSSSSDEAIERRSSSKEFFTEPTFMPIPTIIYENLHVSQFIDASVSIPHIF